MAQGYGIECDVRLSRDGVAFVFHDLMLERMTGLRRAVADCDAETLDAIRLPDGGSIPRLAALLGLCGGQVPLLIEIKASRREVTPVCAAVAGDILRHPGSHAAVMSFNPMVARWFARQHPDIVRGMVVSEQDKPGLRGSIERALAHWAAKPDFVACDIRDLPSAYSRRARLQGLPVLSWTVRSREDRACAAAYAEQIIFEDVRD